MWEKYKCHGWSVAESFLIRAAQAEAARHAPFLTLYQTGTPICTLRFLSLLVYRPYTTDPTAALSVQ